jgi:hypothetical protein
MKKVLAVVLAAALLGVSSFGVSAQVPNVQAYFDANLTETSRDCQGVGVLQDVFIVANNFNMFLSAIEYGVDYSGAAAELIYLGEISAAPLALGTTPIGVAQSWNLPQNAFGPLVVMKVIMQWNCDACQLPAQNAPIVVVPHQVSGFLRGVRWPDQLLVTGLGMTSVVCAGPVPVQETTWGQIKSLYNN